MDDAAIWAAAEQQRAQVMAFGRYPAPLKQYVRLLKQKRATEQKKAAKAAEAATSRSSRSSVRGCTGATRVGDGGGRDGGVA